MKRIFIGCGIVVLLLLGGIGFLVWRFYGDVSALRASYADAIDRTNKLAISAPFDPAAHQDSLDTVRFTQALELRGQIGKDLQAIDDELEELNRAREEGKSDVGMLELISRELRAYASIMPKLAERLESARMSWPEFAWHRRLFWSVLARVDLGAGEPALEPLRGEYAKFQELYDKVRQASDLPQLKDLLGVFPPAVISQAAAVMATDTGRVQEALRAQEFEHFFMVPVTDPAQLGFDKLPEATAERLEQEKPAMGEPDAPEPAKKPK